jgi:tetratricopeptide (TPR) repeat protein
MLVIMAGQILAPLNAVLVRVWARRSHTPSDEIGYVRPRSWIGGLVVGLAFGGAFEFLVKAIRDATSRCRSDQSGVPLPSWKRTRGPRLFDLLADRSKAVMSLHRRTQATMTATLSRARIVGVLLATMLMPSGIVGQSSMPDPWREFPSYDSLIAMRLREGADAEEAKRLLVQAPASVDTFTKLVRSKRLDDALVVLKQALDTADAAQQIAALRALSTTMLEFQRDGTRSYADTIRKLVEPVRAHVATLPREDAARLAWELLYLDRTLDRRGGQVSEFIHDHSGTEAALLAQVDLLMSNPGQILKEIADLDQFARDHSGTNAGAKALYLEGFQLHVNVPATGIEPRGSDPTERLLRVAAIVNELESGGFPRSEWVDQAPSLMNGFFVPDTPPPAYSPENLDREIEIYTEFVRTHLDLPGALDSPDNSLGYVIVSKLGDLFARKGDRIGGIERTLDDLEKSAADPGQVQFFRAQYYARQSTAGPEADRATMAAKAQTALAKLASANLGGSSRRALAFEAAFHFYRRDYARALPEYREYVTRYPSSSWAPIAALRIGECYEQAKDWPKAAAAYARAAATYSSEPFARVLGGAFASRALQAQGRFEDALEAATQALNSWDLHYGIEYTILVSQAQVPSVSSGPVVNLSVTRDDLKARVAMLDRDLRQRGGQLLARGRWELDQRQFGEAVSTLTTFLQQEPRSPVLADARSLLHRGQLELALDLANAESLHYDKAKAVGALDAMAKEPFDAIVATAGLAKALLMATEGRDGDAEALMARTLDLWMVSQHDLTSRPPAEGVDADIAEIRQLVFRPLGDLPVYAGHFRFPTALPRLIVVSPDLQVKTSDGQVRRHTVYQTFPDLDHVLFLTSDEARLLARLLSTIGGTGRSAPARDTPTPNQPMSASTNIFPFWTRFFPTQPSPSQSGLWDLETFPTVRQVEFVDAERTKANVSVVLGYEGATIVLEKSDGKWRAVRLVNQWIA